MAKKVLDSNVLINHWRRRSASQANSRDEPEPWADVLIGFQRTNLILSPIYLEFLVHATSQEQVRLYERFLSRFEVLDRWTILPDDLVESLRIARWVPKHRLQRKPRQLGDCLIRAIANRLRCEIITHDLGFPS